MLIPRVALKSIYGFSDEAGVRIEIESSGQTEIIETDRMNPLELACVRGNAEILKFFVDELNLKQKSEFNMDHENFSLEQMFFIYVPIVKKEAGVFEILLNIPNLWSYEELRQISIFLKQVKWREGYQIFFKAKSVRQHYKLLLLPDRFRFIRDCLMLPYRMELIPCDSQNKWTEALYDSAGNYLQEDEIDQMKADGLEEYIYTYENNLTYE